MIKTDVERITAWKRLMVMAFFANGLGPFGLKVLTARGLAPYQSQYLFYWYLGGVVFALAALLSVRSRVNAGGSQYEDRERRRPRAWLWHYCEF